MEKTMSEETDVRTFIVALSGFGASDSRGSWAVSGIMHQKYQNEARILGLADRADAILKEEMERSQRSPTMTSLQALENARRRLFPEAMGEIQLTDPLDLNVCPAGQGAFYCRTTLPSGLVTPDRGMTLIGTKLVPITHAEWVAANERRAAKKAEEKRNG